MCATCSNLPSYISIMYGPDTVLSLCNGDPFQNRDKLSLGAKQLTNQERYKQTNKQMDH